MQEPPNPRRAPIPVTPARQVPTTTVTPTVPPGSTGTRDSSTNSSTNSSTDSTGDDDDVTVTVYEAVGGAEFFVDLVAGFYRRVAEDPVLLPLYPDAHDLGPAADRLAKFLAQYWGGPTTYSEERGHPRLRMRHVPFTIGPAERDAWLAAMLAALDETMPGTPLDEHLRDAVGARMREYFELSAQHLVNADG